MAIMLNNDQAYNMHEVRRERGMLYLARLLITHEGNPSGNGSVCLAAKHEASLSS